MLTFNKDIMKTGKGLIDIDETLNSQNTGHALF